MKRKTVVIIIVIVVVILLAISAWLIYKKYFKKDTTTGDDELPPPPPDYGGNSGGVSYSPASFPIVKGMSGQAVADVQNAINKKCNKGLVPDGKFGPMTQSALQSCYGTTIVSQALYTQMKFDTGTTGVTDSGCPAGQYKIPGLGCFKIPGTGTPTPNPSANPSGFQPGDKVYAKTLGTMLLYKYPSSNSSIGKINIGTSGQCQPNTVYVCSWLPIGTFVSASSEGFSKIKLEAKHINNDNSMGYTTRNEELYVYTTLIKK